MIQQIAVKHTTISNYYHFTLNSVLPRKLPALLDTTFQPVILRFQFINVLKIHQTNPPILKNFVKYSKTPNNQQFLYHCTLDYVTSFIQLFRQLDTRNIYF